MGWTFETWQLCSDRDNRLFKFEHPGWDPQLERWPKVRAEIREQFKKTLTTFEARLRSLVESRGAVHARRQYSVDNFEWFALYQLAKMSSPRILKQRPDLKGDASTILKGIRAAAELLNWQTPRKSR
jgi:hypothetical protein